MENISTRKPCIALYLPYRHYNHKGCMVTRSGHRLPKFLGWEFLVTNLLTVTRL